MIYLVTNKSLHVQHATKQSSNSKKTYGAVCRSITHLKCITSNKKVLSKSMQDWIFSFCIQSILLFYKVRDSSIRNKYENTEYQNKHLDVLKKHHCYTSLAHLNTQSLSSSFDKFSDMMNKYKFDVVALSETWLKNLSLSMYKSMVINLNSKIESQNLEEEWFLH